MKIKGLNTNILKIGEEIYSQEKIRISNKIVEVVSSLNLDEESLKTAFLISADLSNENVRKKLYDKFGSDFVEKLELFDRISKVSVPDRKKKISSLRKLFIELTNDLSIIFIKLAERLVVLKEAESLSEQNISNIKQEPVYLRRLIFGENSKRKENIAIPALKEQIAEECLYLYSPIAHRLGIRRIYTEMDDTAFKMLYPKEFKRLEKVVEKKRPVYEKKLYDMKMTLHNLFKKQGLNATIQQRVKRLYSIYLKIRNKGVSLDDIYDLMALRIITNKVENCYQALGIVHSQWIPIEGRFRDWITFPKPNGYRSIQTTIISRTGDKFEIQIRTEEMHREAEYGSAAHWAYKEGFSTADSWISRLKEFLENDEYFDNPYELNELLRSDQQRDHIHVLTPKGDIKTLPEGSTAIDFAFAIHTEVGYGTTGSRINGKFAKLKTPLKSGDVVEVITSKNPNPSRDWLDIVKTSKARSKILIWLKKNEQDQIIEEGKRLWEKFKKRYKDKLDEIDEEKSFKNHLPDIGFKSPEDFYSAAAIKSLKLKPSVIKKLYPSAFKKEIEHKPTPQGKKKEEQKAPGIEVEGMKFLKTKLAKCCHPVKGEPIIGYVTKNNEIKVHSKNCRYYQSGSLDDEKVREAKWLLSDSLQRTRVKVFGCEYDDIVDKIENISKEQKLNIVSLERIPTNNRSNGVLVDIEVKDINQLNLFTDKLRKMKDIDSAKAV